MNLNSALGLNSLLWLGSQLLNVSIESYQIITVPWNSLTLGAHAQQGLQYLVCVCVSVCCVCVSVTQHLTFHAIIRATNDTNLLSSG